MTEPSWPGDSMPPANQLRFRRSASWTSVTPAPENPGGWSIAAGIGRDAVDVVARETGVGDRVEARVEREIERVSEEATADVGLADAGDDRAALADLHATGSKNGSHTSS